MASQVSLSAASSDSASPSPPPAQRPPLRSVVVVPDVLGTAFGPIVQGGAPRLPSPPVSGSGWQSRQGRVLADAPRLPSPPGSAGDPCRPPMRRSPPGRGPAVLPSARPPPRSRIPPALYGCCYNYGDTRHISVDCTNPTRCLRCGGNGHIARGCVRPRSSSLIDQRRPPPALRPSPPVGPHPPPSSAAATSRPATVLPPPPPGPPPAGAVRLAFVGASGGFGA
nr:formin-like protein 14 [Aegilops tauschii subsp. strangulata]